MSISGRHDALHIDQAIEQLPRCCMLKLPSISWCAPYRHRNAHLPVLSRRRRCCDWVRKNAWDKPSGNSPSSRGQALILYGFFGKPAGPVEACYVFQQARPNQQGDHNWGGVLP